MNEADFIITNKINFVSDGENVAVIRCMGSSF